MTRIIRSLECFVGFLELIVMIMIMITIMIMPTERHCDILLLHL